MNPSVLNSFEIACSNLFKAELYPTSESDPDDLLRELIKMLLIPDLIKHSADMLLYKNVISFADNVDWESLTQEKKMKFSASEL
jgi:hypothetical protein